MNRDLLTAACDAIARETGRPFALQRSTPVGGGCINDAQELEGADGSRWFLKSNSTDQRPMFEAELDGLRALAATQTIRVPRPLCLGECDSGVFLIEEFLEMGGAHRGGQRRLGEQLARLHQVRQPHFGWHRDNTIGATRQPNPPAEDWVEFYLEHRLRFQFELAARNGGAFDGVDALLEVVPDLFAGYEPQPSLLHGDLWSGNVAYLPDGEPVVFDPACYFGDREAEFGIMVMFGGFGAECLAGYDSVWPRDAGFSSRLPIYELYHHLNHFNLFGSGYAAGCQRLIDRVLRA